MLGRGQAGEQHRTVSRGAKAALAAAGLCAGCQGVAVHGTPGGVPLRSGNDLCTVASDPLPPALQAVCAADLMRRPHVDYGAVVAYTDVTYWVVPGFRPLKMTFFMPSRGMGPFPLVVFVHGGGWRVDPEGTEGASGVAALLQLAQRGYVVAVPAYRTSGEAKFPAQLMDVKAAIRYAKSTAATYHADAARVSVWGASAGGNLAALVATTCGVAQLEPPAMVRAGSGGTPIPSIDPAVDSCVRTAVDWFGPIDFSTLDAQAAADARGAAGHAPAGVHGAAGSPESDYIGCPVATCAVDSVQAPNPIRYVGPRAAPTLIMHGLADRRVPWQQSQQFYDALRASGVDARLVLVADADHEFGGISDERRRQQVDIVIEWLGSHNQS